MYQPAQLPRCNHLADWSAFTLKWTQHTADLWTTYDDMVAEQLFLLKERKEWEKTCDGQMVC